MISNKNILSLKSRRDIYQFILKNPGMTIADISEKMNMSRSTLRHHLNYLIKTNLVSVKVDRKHKRLYVSDSVGVKDKELLDILRQKIPFKIIMYLLYPGFCSKNELAKNLDVSPRVIHFHLKKLLDMKIIKPAEVKDGGIIISYKKTKQLLIKKPAGREIFYLWRNSESIRRVYKVLITYKDTTFDPDSIDAYINFVEEYNRLEKIYNFKKFVDFNSAIDNFIEIFEEIFPSPYHF
jgi:DNA-binding transcriptional ArsR family regulator